MRKHFIKHVPFEGPASMGEWAAANDFSTSFKNIYHRNSKKPMSVVLYLLNLRNYKTAWQI